MSKKTKHFEMTDLFIIMAIIIIITSFIAPNVITSIQKSNQKNIMKDCTHIDIIEKIKTGNRTFNESIQGIMGVNRAEKEFAKSIGVLKERLTKTWRIKPWERNVSNLNNSGRKKTPEYRRF